MNTEIINNLRKEITDIRVYTRKTYEGYKRKELEFEYLTKGSLLEKNFKENNSQRKNRFWYTASEEVIDELEKKDPMELFELLVLKHLEKNVGYGKNPKQFKTPCYLCNQKSLTTYGWSGEGCPDNLERFFCRLCRTSFGWIDIRNDPIELQLEMSTYYLTFAEKDLEKDEVRIQETAKALDEIEERQKKRRRFIEQIKMSIRKLKNHV